MLPVGLRFASKTVKRTTAFYPTTPTVWKHRSLS